MAEQLSILNSLIAAAPIFQKAIPMLEPGMPIKQGTPAYEVLTKA
ncbi:hypothetical protein [Bacillus sp. NEB1478]|nr:hypothetical protein [Bacillus sp. NEB1478]WNB91089.1 hypothetical protein RGB74_14400 [Bacillus sp. NEB1478]